MKKILKRIGIVLLVLLLIDVLALGGLFLYHRILLKKEAPLREKTVGTPVTVDGGTMYVYSEGEGDQTVVFLSGYGTSSPIYDFRPLYRLLSDDFRIAVVEKFGYGFSDQTDLPRDIDTLLSETRQALAGAGIEGPFLLCPHSMSGMEALYWAQQYPEEISGIVFSDAAIPGAYDANGYDPDAQSINEIAAMGHSIRFEKLRLRIDRLKEIYDIVFPKDEVDALYKLENPGKPHIGELLVRHGYSSTVSEAISNYINKLGVKSMHFAPQTAIDMITASGGVPVLAHPFYGDGEQLILNDEMEQRIARLRDMGLRGVEAFYSGFAPRQTKSLIEMAERYGLYVTAGSDYHGSRKLVTLGDTNLDDVSDAPDALIKFLSDIAESMFTVV